MIKNIGIYKLLFDLSQVPLTDPLTLKPKVDKELYNNPEYLAMTNITHGIEGITVEELTIGKLGNKIGYKENAKVFLKRSEDMKELIQQQQNTRKKRFIKLEEIERKALSNPED